jgi:hypothetical protein
MCERIFIVMKSEGVQGDVDTTPLVAFATRELAERHANELTQTAELFDTFWVAEIPSH